jgi:hypothetical protein
LVLEGKMLTTYPDTRVVLLLVGLVLALGVADLGLEVLDVGGDEVAHAREVGPLHVGVEVDLDDTVGDGDLELLVGRAGAAVEDEEGGLVLGGLELLLEVGLVLAETGRDPVLAQAFLGKRRKKREARFLQKQSGVLLTARGGA